MKKALWLGLIFWGILVFFLSPLHASRGLTLNTIEELSHRSGKLGEYKALVIGINEYHDPDIPDLETAVKDARAIASLLKERYGFKVELLLNGQAAKESIYQALRRLAASSKPTDSILIYFAGHGHLDKIYDDGWWIPADAERGKPVTYLDNTQVQKAMRSMAALHVLLISDSCYSGTLFGKGREMPTAIDDKYYLNLYNEKSRWGLTSGNKTPVSDEGTAGHSVFAYQLLKALKDNEKPYITTQEIYTRIAPIVGNNAEQTPLCRPVRNTGDQGGEFVFVSAVKQGAKPDLSARRDDETKRRESKPKQADVSQENLFWESIKDTQDPAFFKEYLRIYPDGTFAGIARLKIEQLADMEEKPAEKEKDIQVAAVALPEKDTGRLYVRTTPETARIRILNIKPKFRQGMALDPGKYNLEISAEGYETKKLSIAVKAGADSNISIHLVSSGPRTIGRDKNYIVYDNRVVKDTRNGLEWVAGPDRNTTWHEAKQWVENLKIDGGGWRMPIRRELKTLYNKGAGTRNMTPYLKTTGWWVWSGETIGSSSAWVFHYYHGRGGKPERTAARNGRGFAVRSRR